MLNVKGGFIVRPDRKDYIKVNGRLSTKEYITDLNEYIDFQTEYKNSFLQNFADLKYFFDGKYRENEVKDFEEFKSVINHLIDLHPDISCSLDCMRGKICYSYDVNHPDPICEHRIGCYSQLLVIYHQYMTYKHVHDGLLSKCEELRDQLSKATEDSYRDKHYINELEYENGKLRDMYYALHTNV